jgi:DNA-binding NarL/FixJ family response regulator
MAKKGPILLIEDDYDDQELTQEAIRLAGAKNEIKIFSSCDDCYHYLVHMGKTQPFIILSDVNLPKETGIEFKERIEKNPRLKNKSIPFVFFSTAADHATVVAAYECRIQGYFVKASTMKELTETLKLIFAYWQTCRHPNN